MKIINPEFQHLPFQAALFGRQAQGFSIYRLL